MNRNKSLDGLKYLLIMLVIIGHFIESSRYNNPISGYLYSFIYSFHMPLFIWMNGYFYKHRTFLEEIKKCFPLFEVCIISHVAFIILKDRGISLVKMLDFSYTPSWYILSLIYWRVFSSILLKIINVKKTLILSLLLEMATFVAVSKYGGVLSLVRTFQFYPFFILGHAMKNNLHVLERFKKPIGLIGFMAIIYVLITSSFLQHQCFFQRAGLLELNKYTQHSLLWLFVFRYSIILCSTAICAWILLLSYSNHYMHKVSQYGQGTLFIYFGQTLLYPFAMRFCSTFTFSLFLSAFVIVILTYLSRTRISMWVMNPISTNLTYNINKHKYYLQKL